MISKSDFALWVGFGAAVLIMVGGALTALHHPWFGTFFSTVGWLFLALVLWVVLAK